MPNTQEEISIVELFSKVKEWVTYLKSKWLLILTLSLAGGVLGYIYAHSASPKYTANYEFVLSSNSKVNGLASLAGQFGLDIGNMNEDAFAGDNIIELFKSERIVKRAIFKNVPSTGLSLINLICRENKLDKALKAKESTKDLLPFPANITQLTPRQDSLVSEIHDFITKNYLKIEKVDKKLSFYSISATSESQQISYYLATSIAQEAAAFYIETKTKMAKENLNMLQHEADSLKNLLGSTIYANAEANDQTYNLNPAYQVHRSDLQQGQIRATVLGSAYTEVVKNLEIAKISLQKETPLYQVIDTPNLPLKRIRTGALLFVLGGFGFFFFITSVIILAKRKKIVPSTQPA